MAALTGLTGLAGYQVEVDTNAQATPEQRYGGPADPRHAELGERAHPYPWESQMTPGGSHGPYGPENQLLGDPDWVWQPAGNEFDDPDFDHTPATNAAPWPKGILSGPIPGENPDTVAEQLRQSALIHGTDRGASAKLKHTAQGWANQDSWAELWNVTPGHTDAQDLPAQYKSAGFGWGTTDRTQSFARQNGHGFDAAHMLRRYATGSIPGNNDWMRPGGRVMAKTLPGPARPPIGPDSPFAGQDLGQSFSPSGAMLFNAPTEYTAPPQPTLAQPVWTQNAPTGSDASVEWY